MSTQQQEAAPITSDSAVARDAFIYQPQPNSPLLRLPGELRNLIYDYVLGAMQIRMSYVKDHWPLQVLLFRHTSSRDTSWFRVTSALVAILLVCRQLYTEARDLIFTLNEFTGQSKWCLQNLIVRLKPKQWRRITNIRIVLDRYNMDWNSWGKWIGVRQTIMDRRPVACEGNMLKKLTIEWTGRSLQESWESLQGKLYAAVRGGVYGPVGDEVEIEMVRNMRREQTFDGDRQ